MTFAFEAFKRVADAPYSGDRNAELMFHASCLVCAVRRAGRLLEALSRQRSLFKQPVADLINLEWRKKRAFFDRFVAPRDAIEHIDGEVRRDTRLSLFNLWGNKFHVTDDISVELTDDVLTTVQSVRDTIAAAIVEHYPHPTIDMLLKHYPSPFPRP